jgi:hypothetical protein
MSPLTVNCRGCRRNQPEKLIGEILTSLATRELLILALPCHVFSNNPSLFELWLPQIHSSFLSLSPIHLKIHVFLFSLSLSLPSYLQILSLHLVDL